MSTGNSLRLPNLKGVVHPQAEQAIRLLYQSQNDLAGRVEQVQAQVQAGAGSAASESAATTPTAGLNGSYNSPPPGLTTAISTLPLLSSPPTGIWTLSYYLYTLTAGSGGSVTLTLGWQDEAGARTSSSQAVSLLSLAMAQGSLVVRTASPQPVTFSTTLTGASGSFSYGLFLRLSRLE